MINIKIFYRKQINEFIKKTKKLDKKIFFNKYKDI